MSQPLDPISESDQARLQSFTANWTRAQPAVASFINLMIPDFHQAEDVLQSVAKALIEKYHLYDDSRSFTAWAIGMARFEILRSRRSVARDKHQFETDIVEQIVTSVVKKEGQIPQLRYAMGQCLHQVQGRSKDALELRYVNNLKPRQIASQFGITANAVSVMLYKVRVVLKRCVELKLKQNPEASDG